MNILLQDPLYLKYKNKMKLHVLHIANSENEGQELKKVNPLINDLAAPVKTLVGSYGTQTAVNDNRLINLLKYHFPKDTLYNKINLYDAGPKMNYSMNWVISKKSLDGMNKSLKENKDLIKIVEKINSR